MPVYDRTNVPTAVSRGDLDPALKACGFPQFTRSSAACHQATLELADLIKTKIG